MTSLRIEALDDLRAIPDHQQKKLHSSDRVAGNTKRKQTSLTSIPDLIKVKSSVKYRGPSRI